MKETPGSWAPTGEMFLYSEPWGFMSRLKSFEVRTCNYVVLPPPPPFVFESIQETE